VKGSPWCQEAVTAGEGLVGSGPAAGGKGTSDREKGEETLLIWIHLGEKSETLFCPDLSIIYQLFTKVAY